MKNIIYTLGDLVVDEVDVVSVGAELGGHNLLVAELLLLGRNQDLSLPRSTLAQSKHECQTNFLIDRIGAFR